MGDDNENARMFILVPVGKTPQPVGTSKYSEPVLRFVVDNTAGDAINPAAVKSASIRGAKFHENQPGKYKVGVTYHDWPTSHREGEQVSKKITMSASHSQTFGR